MKAIFVRFGMLGLIILGFALLAMQFSGCGGTLIEKGDLRVKAVEQSIECDTSKEVCPAIDSTAVGVKLERGCLFLFSDIKPIADFCIEAKLTDDGTGAVFSSVPSGIYLLTLSPADKDRYEEYAQKVELDFSLQTGDENLRRGAIEMTAFMKRKPIDPPKDVNLHLLAWFQEPSIPEEPAAKEAVAIGEACIAPVVTLDPEPVETEGVTWPGPEVCVKAADNAANEAIFKQVAMGVYRVKIVPASGVFEEYVGVIHLKDPNNTVTSDGSLRMDIFMQKKIYQKVGDLHVTTNQGCLPDRMCPTFIRPVPLAGACLESVNSGGVGWGECMAVSSGPDGPQIVTEVTFKKVPYGLYRLTLIPLDRARFQVYERTLAVNMPAQEFMAVFQLTALDRGDLLVEAYAPSICLPDMMCPMENDATILPRKPLLIKQACLEPIIGILPVMPPVPSECQFDNTTFTFKGKTFGIYTLSLLPADQRFCGYRAEIKIGSAFQSHIAMMSYCEYNTTAP